MFTCFQVHQSSVYLPLNHVNILLHTQSSAFLLVRYVIFCILWAFTGGKLKFWLLPNLTADCGFKESFIPVYEYEFDGGSKLDDEDSLDGSKEVNDENIETEEKKEDSSNQSEKTGDKLEQKIADGENNSGSNKDTDEGEAWVKISRTDAHENSTEQNLTG